VLVKHVYLKNFLSFGSEGMPLDLKPLNVLIGPNGSGKSNFLEAFEFLRNAPGDIAKPIRQGGGISDWLWKNGGERASEAVVDFVIEYPAGHQDLRYGLSFAEVGRRFEVRNEWIKNESVDPGFEQPYFYYHYNEDGRTMISIKGDANRRSLRREDVALDKSILAQRRDPDQFPEITYLGKKFEEIQLFREWGFGRYTAPRLPQKADLPDNFLLPDASNLGLVLSHLREEVETKQQLLEALRQLYEGIEDYGASLKGGTVQVFFQEGRRFIPATRLSDGTLRYLALLAILLHPTPPPLICIEEPELGLHPDIMPTVAKLLKEASTRTQLIVTSHSDILLDALTETPEAIVVCEKTPEQGTALRRLDPEQLKPWLEKYRLGELWTRGGIGGLRW
jgi:predicted ATPase